MAEDAGDDRKKGQDKAAGLDRSRWKSSEDEPARLNQGITEAGSSTAKYAGTKSRRSEVEEARWDVTKLEAESTYDVFLSSTPDSIKLAEFLYHRLKDEEIHVCKDDGLVDTSKEFLQSVYNSKIYMPIFSEDYADSSRFLDTLAVMVEETSRSGGKKEILPVLCNWGLSDEKLELTSISRDALDAHRRNRGAKKAEPWKKALLEAGKVKIWKQSSYKSDEAFVTAMVAEVLFRLMTEHNNGFEDLSSRDNPMLSHGTLELEDSQESRIMELLELEVNDVRIVGIHGKDGIGKTALAKIVYDQISHRFDACSFLVEIKETKQQPGGVQYLQTKLIFDIFKKEHEVVSAFEGVQFLKELFRNMKVLIVLDDIERVSLLEEFVGANLDWFGSGSRIIVTSKESRVLQGFAARDLAYSYDVNPMDDKLAFNLFWQYASGKSSKLRSYVKIAIKILKAAKGLPLLLKVYGSYLHNKGLEEWIRFEDVIQQFQEDFQKLLRTIYDALDEKQKQMYLDIARFPLDVDCRIASYMLHHYDDETKVLRHMSLIKTDENKIGMHSLLRCLAREIIQEGSNDPGTAFGLHIPDITQDTNKGKEGKDHLNTEEAGFDIMPNTIFLSLGCVNVGEQFADALLKVRWLHWQGCNKDAISIYLEKNENLVILDLSWSKVTEYWKGWKDIKMKSLKVLNLTGCVDLLVTPSFSCYPKLEILILERCSQLVYLDPSINDLKLLVTLNLKFCSELSMLPVEMDGMKALEELLIDGTSIRELPASIGKLVQLKNLSAANCLSLVHVPDSVCGLEALSVLLLDNSKIVELPMSIGHLEQLRRLSLRGCGRLGLLPESIGGLRFLEELDISHTGISRLPDSTDGLWSLVVLKMDFCFVRELPLIGGLEYLRELHACWCRSLQESIPIEKSVEESIPIQKSSTESIPIWRRVWQPSWIPWRRKRDNNRQSIQSRKKRDDNRQSIQSIFESTSLRELRLRGTRISSLPSQIESMSSLETLDLLHCNNLADLPTLPPKKLSNLYVNSALKQKILESPKFCSWRHLLE